MANDCNISIYYQNCRGIRTKLNTLYLNIMSHAYDVIILTETWLTLDISDNEFIDQRYLVFRCDRNRSLTNKKDGGGVLIAISKELNPSSISFLPPLTLPEHVIVKVPAKNNKYHIICATYIPPNAVDDTYLTFLNSLSVLCDDSSVENIILTGDFNLPSLTWVKKMSYMEYASNSKLTNVTRFLSNFCSQHVLKQYNHVFNSSGRILDLLFCNTHAVTFSPDVPLLPVDAYHPAFYVHISFSHPTHIPKCIADMKLNYHKSNYNKINSDISHVDWNVLLDNLTPNESVSTFYEKLYEIIKSHTPTCRPTNVNFPNWFSKSLIYTYKKKTRAWVRWKKYGNLWDYEVFSSNRKKFKKVADICYSKYINSIEDSVATHIKSFWTYVASRKTTNKIPSTVHYNQISSNDPITTCNLFATFFQSVYEPSTFNCDSWEPPSNNADHDVFLCKLQLSLDEIHKELKLLDSTKGPGPDGIPSIFLKNTCDTLCYPLLIVYNKCLSCGIFPDVWKHANIVPVHKSGSKHDVATYRPISILSAFSKLFERLVHNKLYPAIRSVLIKEQHGFVKDRSCISNLLIFTSQLFDSLDNRQQIDAVYTDFQKAFDKIDHTLLLNKIAYNGIRGDLLRWFISYITNRTQKVVVNGFASGSFPVTSGVPQGSILGPLLFILYINDIKDCFQNSKFLLYADDLKVYKIISNKVDCFNFQQDLDRFSNYCSSNKLYLSLPKCHVITFTKKKNITEFNYRLANTPISKVSFLRDLGVLLDSKLHLDVHIEKIVNKAYKMFGFVMRSSRDFRRPSTFLHLYKSIVRPQLEFAVPIWNPFYIKYSERLEQVQRKYLRAMNFRCYRKKMSYHLLLKKYDLLTLKSRRKLLDVMTLYNVCRNNFDCPDLVKSLCYLVPRTVYVREIRTRRLFATSLCKSNAGSRSPLHRLVETYNNEFHSIDILFLSKNSFKKQIQATLKDHQITV